jgi:ankyrin repeat protein
MDKKKLPINILENKAYIYKDICFTNDLDVISTILDEGIIDINAWGICGHTPIHYHAMQGHFDIVKMLLSFGANLEIKNVYGDYIMDTLLQYGQHDIYNYLMLYKK